MNTLQVKVAFNLFSNSNNRPFAKCKAIIKGNSVRLSNWQIDEDLCWFQTKSNLVHDWTLRNLAKETRKTIHLLLNDPDGMKYPIRWNDDTCLEHFFKEA